MLIKSLKDLRDTGLGHLAPRLTGPPPWNVFRDRAGAWMPDTRHRPISTAAAKPKSAPVASKPRGTSTVAAARDFAHLVPAPQPFEAPEASPAQATRPPVTAAAILAAAAKARTPTGAPAPLPAANTLAGTILRAAAKARGDAV